MMTIIIDLLGSLIGLFGLIMMGQFISGSSIIIEWFCWLVSLKSFITWSSSDEITSSLFPTDDFDFCDYDKHDCLSELAESENC